MSDCLIAKVSAVSDQICVRMDPIQDTCFRYHYSDPYMNFGHT